MQRYAHALPSDTHVLIIVSIVPAICGRDDSPALALMFGNELFELARKAEFSSEAADQVFRALAPSIVAGFTLPKHPSQLQQRKQSWWNRGQHPRLDPDRFALTGAQLTLLHRHLLYLSLKDQHTAMLQRICAQCLTIHESRFEDMMLAYLHDVYMLMGRRGISMESPEYQELFVHVLYQYVLRSVKYEPAKSRDWATVLKGSPSCGCRDCHIVDAFAQSPTQKMAQFEVTADRRDHLQRRLNPMGVGNLNVKVSPATSSPLAYTLIVTKTNNEYNREHRAWDKRAQEAKKRMRAIASEYDLYQLLGKHYGALCELRAVTLRRCLKGQEVGPGDYMIVPTPPAPIGDGSVKVDSRPVLSSNADANRMDRDLSGLKRRRSPTAGDENVRPVKRTAVIDLCDSP